MGDALQEITEIRNDAFYTSQAQKLDMIFKKQSQNPHTQYRWIWQLIQNAKDTPNQFNKVRIKQKLSDKFFISSHNGNAFTLKELHSVATQYSTKCQKNTQNTKTTGKYGTGFLSTHLISQKITIQSILKFKQIQKKDSDQEQQMQKKAKQGQTDEIRQQNEKELMVPEDKQKEQNNKKDKQNAPVNETFYYKKFNDLILDRSYQDRDKELPKKIKKAEKKLTDLANDAQYSTIYGANKQLIDYYENKRDVNCYDTHFKYEIYDINKFPIIEKAISNVKSLIPYAFLFNSNLDYYEFIDERNNDKNLSFSVQRAQLTRIIRDISIFKYQISSQYDNITKTFKNVKFEYILAKIRAGNPIAGIPLDVNGDDWKILRIDQSLSQVFKDFPLIGSVPIKWNAIINSNQFYPDEQRSHLLLKSSDLTNQSRIQTNQQNLIYCFEGIKDLYLFLAKYKCSAGLQNLLIMNSNNQFSKNNDKLKIELTKFKNEILDTSFIPAKKGNQSVMCKPKELRFIQSQNMNLSLYQRKLISVQLNWSFAFLYQNQILLETNLYYWFYDVLDILDYSISDNKALQADQYIYLENCLLDLAKLTYNNFYQKFKENSFKKLHEIYGILTKQKLPIWEYEIFLNEKLVFVKFQIDKMMKKMITINQQKLLTQLGIEYRNMLIHTAFIDYFSQQLKNHEFTSVKMQALILSVFPNIDKNIFANQNLLNLKRLDQLYCILMTFKSLPQKTCKLLLHFKQLYALAPINFSSELSPNQKLTQKCIKELSKKFVLYFSIYFHAQMIKCKTLHKFSSDLLNKIDSKNILDYLVQLFSDEVMGNQLSKIPYKLSMSQKFILQGNLKKLPKSTQLPNQLDVQIFNILKNNNEESITEQIVLDIYPLQSLTSITETTYEKLYQRIIRQNYDRLSVQNKNLVLDYARKIQKNFKQTTSASKTSAEKYKAWTEFLKIKHQRVFSIKKSHPTFQKEHVKEFLYQILNDPKQLQNEAENYFKRKRQKPSVLNNNKKVLGNQVKKLKKN